MGRVMIDIETLDTKPSGRILSIGAVAFAKHIGASKFYRVLDYKEQDNRTMSEKTLLWWLEQGEEAREIFISEDFVPLRQALQALRSWLSEVSATAIWTNGPSFDQATLEHAYTQCELDIPWKYNAGRDVRTIREVADFLCMVVEEPVEGTPHNALSDAEWQAQYVVNFYKRLDLLNGEARRNII